MIKISGTVGRIKFGVSGFNGGFDGSAVRFEAEASEGLIADDEKGYAGRLLIDGGGKFKHKFAASFILPSFKGIKLIERSVLFGK